MNPRLSCPIKHFDHRSPEMALRREEISKSIRDTPIFFSEAWGGFYVVTSYDLVHRVLRDAATFSSAKASDGSGGVTIPSLAVSFMPAELDPPEHTALRRVINPLFDAHAMSKFELTMREIIDNVMDRVIEKREFDVVHDIADVIPGQVTLRYMGFAPDDCRTMVQAGQAAMGTAEDPEAAAAGFQKMTDLIREIIRRRTESPTDDAVSSLIHQQEYVFTDDQLFWTVFTLTVGGIENVAAFIGNVIYELAENVELRARLRNNPDEMPKAIEEFLRYFTPGGGLARTVTTQTQLGECTLEPGDRVLLWLPSANKDDLVFDGPDLVDIERGGRRQHLSFSAGRHFCVGAPMARLELTYLFQEVLRRMPEYTVDRENSRRFQNSGNMYGWWSMPANVGSRP